MDRSPETLMHPFSAKQKGTPEPLSDQATSSRFVVIQAFIELRSRPGPTPPPADELDEPRERSFYTQLLQGMVRYDLLLEAELVKRVRKHKKLQRSLRTIIKLGLFELLFMDRVPARASIHQAGWLAEKFRVAASKPLINGVLRRFQRELDQGYDPHQFHPFELAESIPGWMFRRWSGSYGKEMARSICRASNQYTGLHFCMASPKLSKVVRDEFMRKEINFRRHDSIPEMLRVDGGWRIWETQAFRRGWISVIDPASIHFLHWAKPWIRGRILDACAAPGGKSMKICGFSQVQGLYLSDISHARLLRLRKNFQRTHSAVSGILRSDGRALPFPSETFDCVLLDVPCSSTGTLQKNPDIKWIASEKDLLRHLNLQKILLEEGARVLRPSGVLVYATCSLETEENEMQALHFLESHSSFIPAGPKNETTGKPEGSRGLAEGTLKLLPDKSHGGFFAAAFRKKPKN